MQLWLYTCRLLALSFCSFDEEYDNQQGQLVATGYLSSLEAGQVETCLVDKEEEESCMHGGGEEGLSWL